ncbi:MAG: polyprenyl synthetase family protein [candidate division KSB1 bacterium]|nr:polyprenyl synthetase family protein [candidate division KSB1 bacterium]
METHIAGPVKKSLDRFEEKFKDLLTSKVSFADFILQYVSEKQGKRIRPIVIFLSSKLHGAIDHDAIQSALVIEMFHTATLIHDDVVDESNQRRGERTVNDRWNNKTAVLIGDFLFSKTLAGMVELENKEALRLLATASEAITEGELLQIASSGKSNLSESEYYEIIQNKTAVLFRIASQLGCTVQ